MADSSQRPEKKQTTLKGFFSQASNGSNPEQPSPQSELSSVGKKRPAPEVIVLSDSDEGSEAHESVPSSGSRRKRVKTGAVDSASVSDGIDEGEVGDSGSSRNPSSAASEAAAPSVKSHRGWNHGVSNGLRTSFGAKAQNGTPNGTLKPSTSQTAPALVVEETPELASTSASAEDAGTEVSELQVAPEPTVVDSWDLPPKNNSWSMRPRAGETWKTRFESWCADLFKRNPNAPGIWDLATVRDAWSRWLHSQPIISHGLKAVAEKYGPISQILPEEFDKMVRDALGLAPAASPPPIQDTQEWEMVHGWKLPPVGPLAQFDIPLKNTVGWQLLFLQWCQALQQINGPLQVNPNCKPVKLKMQEAYFEWLARAAPAIAKQKPFSARRGFVECMEPIKSRDALISVLDGTLFSKLSLTLPHSEPDSPESVMEITDEPDSPKPAVEIADSPVQLPSNEQPGERRRYFPGVGSDEVFCVVCTSSSHHADACPRYKCGFCQSTEHRSLACPTAFRCATCHLIGHNRIECPTGKLAPPPAEGEDRSIFERSRLCVLCQSNEHFEKSCINVWRSYEPDSGTVRKIKSLVPYCYRCGEEGHYGAECEPKPDAKPYVGPWRTWTHSNLEMYLDPNSPEEAIAITLPPDAITTDSWSGRPDFGKSIVPTRHVFFEAADDDDDNEAFIRPPVQRNSRPGQITFTSGGGNVFPPLPPGPPPPLPPLPPGDYQKSNQGSYRGGKFAASKHKGRRGRGRGGGGGGGRP